MTLPAQCSILALELACYLALRSETFYVQTFTTFLCGVTLCVVMSPLFLTGTTSYGAATEMCYDYTYARVNATQSILANIDSPEYNPEWSMDDIATRHLFPQHLFNSISTVISLFGFCTWLIARHHIHVNNSEQAQNLDRTCECDFLIFALSPSLQLFFLLFF
jgi:hypothetical protein